MMKKRLWDKGKSINVKIHSFTVGNDPEIDMEIICYDILASAAHAKMLAKINILSKKELEALLSALKIVNEEVKKSSFIILYELEDCHTAIETRLVELVGDAGKKIHTGRSRNDQVMVAVRLYMRSSMLDIASKLIMLSETLMQCAKKWSSEPLPGYTHMQPAMPTTVGTWLQSYAEYCISLLQDGSSLLKAIDTNPLGVASGFGAPIKLDRDLTTKLLGFSSTQRNPIFVQSTRGREELKMLHWLCDISSLIERIGVDLCLFMTKEYGFITLPESFTTGSSIMPQKRNPDIAELLRARASKTRAARVEVEGTVSKLASNYHRDYQYTKEPLVKAIKNVNECIEVATLVFENISINIENISNSMPDEIYATHDVYRQVEEGIAFRDAYLATAKKVDEGTLEINSLVQEMKCSDDEFIEAEEKLCHLKDQYVQKYNFYKDMFGKIFLV